MPVLKAVIWALLAFGGQLLLAPLLSVGEIRPDFILLLLVYLSARYGRIPGILAGFTLGLLQDATGAVSVLGINALSKSVVGYVAGTLNGNLSIWTPRVVNLYIYGSFVGHALIYQSVMAMGLDSSIGLMANHIVIEAFMSSLMMTGLRYLVPLVRSPL